MIGANSLYPEDWKEKARKDWRRITVLLKDGDAEGGAFFLQQTLEKYLKGFLLERGWKLRKIHELNTLLDYAVEFDAGLEEFRDLCEEVKGYYLAGRYPFNMSPEPTIKDIEINQADAEKMIKALFDEET